MGSAKAILKHIPGFMPAVRKLRDGRERHKTMRINNRYRAAIEPLLDSRTLEAKITVVQEAARLHPENAIFYIISQSNEKVGIFGYINCFLPHIAYAVANGWVPVIDMESHRYIYTPDTGRTNVWEMFFEQPCGLGLADLTGKKTLRCPEELWYRWMPNTCPLMDDAHLAMWSRLYQAFVRPNREGAAYLNRELETILREPEKTVGVIYRGTTYTKGQAKGHPIQPTMKMLADQTARVMAEQGCDRIYLASDEKSIVDYMNSRFPGQVLINQRVYYDEVDGIDYGDYNKDGTDITGNLFQRPDNHYLIGIEYISSIHLVSHCACLVAGACGGSTAALYMNAMHYKSKYIFNLGKYGYDPLPEDSSDGL